MVRAFVIAVAMLWTAGSSAGQTQRAAITVVDARGVSRQPLKAAAGGLAALFFVTHDCPISNHHAGEIRRVCERYADRGLSCSLVYVDPALTNTEALAHAEEYHHGSYPVIVDRDHRLVRAMEASVTPEVVVVTDDGRAGYQGRIDDSYAALGVRRRQPQSHDLQDALDALLARRTVAVPKTPPVGCFIP